MTRNAFSTTTKGMCPKMCKNRLVSPRKQPFPSYKSSNSRHTFLSRTSKKLFPSLRKLYHQERARQNLHRLNAESFPPAKRTKRRKRTFSKACQNLIPANSALCSLFPPKIRHLTLCRNTSSPFYLIIFQSCSFSWIHLSVTSCSRAPSKPSVIICSLLVPFQAHCCPSEK